MILNAVLRASRLRRRPAAARATPPRKRVPVARVHGRHRASAEERPVHLACYAGLEGKRGAPKVWDSLPDDSLAGDAVATTTRTTTPRLAKDLGEVRFRPRAGTGDGERRPSASRASLRAASR